MSVALRKESVDRNSAVLDLIPLSDPSLSARRAWIEISVCFNVIDHSAVALRKESVDRNFHQSLNLPSRPIVALRKESVDRNVQIIISGYARESRSPQGERG